MSDDGKAVNDDGKIVVKKPTGVVINPSRNFKFEWEHEDGQWIYIILDFPYAEDLDYEQIRKHIKDKPEKETKGLRQDAKTRARNKDKKKEKNKEITIEQERAFYTTIRTAIVDCGGFIGEDGEPWKIINPDKTVNVMMQKFCFEYIKNKELFWERVLMSYAGVLDPKNLRTGLGEQSSTDGTQDSVEPATSLESARLADTSTETSVIET